MPPRTTLKNQFSENRLFLNRIVVAFAVILLLCAGLTARLIYLQVVGHEMYTMQSRNNRISISPLPPTRGLIYDRKGKILAENVPVYSLELIPEQIEDLNDTLARLQRLLQLTDDEIDQFLKLRRRRKRFASIPLKLRLSDEEVARFSVQRPQFPGVDIHARLLRNYPYGELTSHVVGYVGRINEQELNQIDPALYRGTHYIGKTGIEKFYETTLHGKAGHEEIETNAQGRAINSIGNTPPTPGSDLTLTLDIQLQAIAEAAMGQYNGAVVAMEPGSGNVLVMLSQPGFDANLFTSGISTPVYQALQNSHARPLFNRALHGQYPPGSTMKPFIALAGLEYGVIDANGKIYCPGYYQLPNVSHRYRDWKRWGHGMINMKDAVTQSCDVYFYDLAHGLGIDRMSPFLNEFGFGQKTGLDIQGEKAGLMPSREWKQRRYNQPWYPGETLITGIGQGFTQVTALQLARATSILANRGTVITPHLVSRINHSDDDSALLPDVQEKLGLNPNNVDMVINSMINVVHGARGTARIISKNIDYQIAGKTGTAQVFTVAQDEEYNEDEIEKALRDHALFIAFAPADEPRIAVAVVVENGGHGGSVAAPIAGSVIRAYLSDEQP